MGGLWPPKVLKLVHMVSPIVTAVTNGQEKIAKLKIQPHIRRYIINQGATINNHDLWSQLSYYAISPYVLPQFEFYDLLMALWASNDYLAGPMAQLNIYWRILVAHIELWLMTTTLLTSKV